MKRIRTLLCENTYLFLEICLLTAHASLEMIYLMAHNEMMIELNLLSMITFVSMIIWNKRMTKSQQFYVIYVEILVFSMIAVWIFGDLSCYSINVVPLIPLICQWDYDCKHVEKNRDLKNRTVVLLIGIVIIVYLIEQVVDGMRFFKDPYFPSYYSYVISYFNFVVMLIAILIGNVMWLLIANNTSEQLERVLRETDYVANHDKLTGLENRNSLDDFMKEAEASDAEYALLMGDVDHFKQINDTYGHDCGDYILQEISELIQKKMREKDRCYRWGGEEIIVVIPQTKESEAKRRGENIRREIENHIYEYEGQRLHITATIGVALSEGRDTKTVLREVDEYLYYGKESGRNCVISRSDMKKKDIYT